MTCSPFKVAYIKVSRSECVDGLKVCRIKGVPYVAVIQEMGVNNIVVEDGNLNIGLDD